MGSSGVATYDGGGDNVYISACKKNFIQDHTLTSSRLFVTCNVQISYQPNAILPTPTTNNRKAWPRSSERNLLPRRILDYETSHSFRFPCSCPDFDDNKSISAAISQVISDMDIPFSLDKTQWRTNFFGKWTPLDSKDDLIKRIVEFSGLVVGESWNNTTCREYRMNIIIEKKMSLPVELYEAMIREKKEKRMMLDLEESLLEAARSMTLSRWDLEDMALDALRKEGGMTIDKRSMETLILQVQRRLMGLRNSESELRSRELKAWELGLLEIVKVDGATVDEMEACSICLQKVEMETFVSRMPNCSHMFHLDCIYMCLLRNRSCPLCRSPLSS